ncbi:MAG: TetR/AcrR family transcriptional regulator [Steroidobacteraceae bacterium]|nr:TetR/AcrR family transcriptional regulator [Steroidobacteraceae bacterium]
MPREQRSIQARPRPATQRSPATRAARAPTTRATPRWSRDRDGKKRALLQAFDRLLQERGAHRVGVNAVVERAGVGKALLYHYFGGLDGLAAEWARNQDFLPGDTELMGGDPQAFARLSTRQQLTRNYQRYARALRSRPRTLEFLLAELLTRSDVLSALENVRTDYGKTLARYFSRPEDYRRDDVIALQVILYAAINYLCLRSRTSPRYFHLRLDREADWEKIDGMFALTVDRVLGRRRPSPPVHEDARDGQAAGHAPRPAESRGRGRRTRPPGASRRRI